MDNIIMTLLGWLNLLALFAMILGVPAAIIWLLSKSRTIKSINGTRERREAKNQQVYTEQNATALAVFGATPEDRSRNIEAAFDKRDSSLALEIDYLNAVTGYFKAVLTRPIAGMRPRDREVLRTVYHLRNLGLTNDYDFYFQRLGIIWGDGAATAPTWEFKNMGEDTKTLADAVRRVQNGISLEPAIAAAIEKLTKALAAKPQDPLLRKLYSRIHGNGGDLQPGPPLKPTTDLEDSGLIVGRDEDDPSRLWRYEGEGIDTLDSALARLDELFEEARAALFAQQQADRNALADRCAGKGVAEIDRLFQQQAEVHYHQASDASAAHIKAYEAIARQAEQIERDTRNQQGENRDDEGRGR